MSLKEMKLDCQIKQKKGIHFILASVLIWTAVFVIQISSLDQLTKNMLTFCCTAPLMPLAFFISKIIKVDFQNKENPLTNLGMIFSANQILYLVIAMWIYPTIPDKMLMVIAIIFGAHLLPFGWLYDSKSYYFLSVIVTILALIIGLNYPPFVLAGMMILIELIFSTLLYFEIRKLSSHTYNLGS